MTQDILPTERDREAAASWYADVKEHTSVVVGFRDGKLDWHPMVQLLAKHAATARAEALEEAANKARDLYLFPPPTSRAARFHQRVTQDAISDAIRALVSDDGGIHG